MKLFVTLHTSVPIDVDIQVDAVNIVTSASKITILLTNVVFPNDPTRQLAINFIGFKIPEDSKDLTITLDVLKSYIEYAIVTEGSQCKGMKLMINPIPSK